jgi:hypothetical protein
VRKFLKLKNMAKGAKLQPPKTLRVVVYNSMSAGLDICLDPPLVTADDIGL